MGEESLPLVKAVDMAKKYGDFIALHPLNVEVHAGEFFGVFGQVIPISGKQELSTLKW